MSNSLAVVGRDRWLEALDLLVSSLPAALRERQKALLHRALADDPTQAAGLLGHFSDELLAAACWLQPQAGRTANLWPPVIARGQDVAIAVELVAKAVEAACRQNAVLLQSLLATDAGGDAAMLKQAGFSHVADLLYLVSLAETFPASCPAGDLELVPFLAADARRMERMIERTYQETCDCPALNGVRAIGDVLDGYRAVGTFRPELWLLARRRGDDAGCILLADHAPEPVWELVYMGVAPEARGRGMGLEITRYAQWLAAREKIERLVLAVDAANDPAIEVYAAAGFVSWDRRSVFVRALTNEAL